MSEVDTKSIKSKKGGLRQFIDDNMSKDYNTINKKQENDASDQPTNEEDGNTIIVTKEFKENIIKYITYDDIIKQKQDEIKELKKKKDPHEKFIMDYLVKLNEDGIDVTGGTLKINKSETKTPVSKDNIKECYF